LRRNKFLTSSSKWVWVFVLVLIALIVLGLVILPEVLRHDYAAPRTPAGLYIMTLINLTLFVGVLISLAIERFERIMVILFVSFRIGETAWEYVLGRHSLWYLTISVLAHLVVGSLVLLFLSGRIEKRGAG
jgi:hypothetical protein